MTDRELWELGFKTPQLSRFSYLRYFLFISIVHFVFELLVLCE